MEVLTTLVRKEKEISELRGFRVNEEVETDIFQFTDDTIIILEGDTANLWSMKATFRGFEFMWGLRITFNKRYLYEINVGDWFLEAASTFLTCRVCRFSFKFLGVKVGGNPRNLSMWKDLISFLRRRLAEWRGKNLNIAGRVVLINSVINAIPIYSLSFYKALSKVIQEIRSIHSRFLWGGSESKKSFHWICWDTICKSTEEGGLCVKNVEIMNAALISKWKWRILSEKEAVWSGILKARYGNVKLKVLIGDISVVGKKDSIWWRDVLVSDNYVLLQDKHFAGAIDCEVGNEEEIPFWYVCWADQQPVREAFPKLFLAAANHLQSVTQAGHYEGDDWMWDISSLFATGSVLAEDVLQELRLILMQ
ncbi:uncharacterized protein LOC131641677 [Vicia villosa]|uniref:uncharacterized protein LOC131641677 n=1 Tax=Vicia villosa TaxID=3911 RepID=UPI00273AF40C|nr:uncharacterized protein LOC131641677 [Vicia villosa]